MYYPVFGVRYNKKSASPLVERLSPESDPLGIVTVLPPDDPAWFDQFHLFDVVRDGYGEMPEFFYKMVDTGEEWYFYVSQGPTDGLEKHPGSGVAVGKPERIWDAAKESRQRAKSGKEAQQEAWAMYWASRLALAILEIVRNGTMRREP